MTKGAEAEGLPADDGVPALIQPAEAGVRPARPAGSAAPAKRWLERTPNRTFALYPAVVLLGRLLTPPSRRGPIHWLFAPLLAWGYLQYRYVGQYRIGRGGGGPGVEVPPDRIVDEGPYGIVRNPMYLGHLIFMSGLVLMFRSRLAAAILVVNAWWFNDRVVADEARLAERFGEEYEVYRRRVKRWIPWVV